MDLFNDFSITAAEPEISPAPYENPVDRLSKNRLNGEGNILMHGVGNGNDHGRFSAVASDPSFVVSVTKDVVRFRSGGKELSFSASPTEVLAELEQFMKNNRTQTSSGFFGGGLVCFVSYDMNRYYEKVENKNRSACPDIWCAFYPVVRVFDHSKNEAFDIFWKTKRRGATNVSRADDRTDRFYLAGFECDESRRSYLEKIDRIKRYIGEGDVYQVNLSRLLTSEFRGDAMAFYRAISETVPASHGAFLEGGDFQLLSLSPELFFSVGGGRIKTSPVKGTAPRSAVPEADFALRRKLGESEKNRAENLMIVDLMRNDLGRICKPGTVTVENLFGCETLPYAHQLVSTISGELSHGTGLQTILSALWPGGSVTGAPKVRAMEIINELETTARGAYCGSLVAWGMDGGMTASLLIRTLFLSGGVATYRTGGGITADSDPADEYDETSTKALVLENVASKVPA